jgi:hypothetical protein
MVFDPMVIAANSVVTVLPEQRLIPAYQYMTEQIFKRSSALTEDEGTGVPEDRYGRGINPREAARVDDRVVLRGHIWEAVGAQQSRHRSIRNGLNYQAPPSGIHLWCR